MATGNSKNPTISFHPRTFGKNVELRSNGFGAARVRSFDNAIVFSHRPVENNEHLFLKIVSVEDDDRWLTSFALGFTTSDPNRINQADLRASAGSSVSRKDDISYVRGITSKLHNGVVVEIFFNQKGAYYILDAQEFEICSPIAKNRSLWAVVDIRGNVSAVEWTVEPDRALNTAYLLKQYQRKPHMLPIKYFLDVAPAFLQPVSFFDTHGREVELLCENKVVFRLNVAQLSKPYVFVNLAMERDDDLYIRILSVDSSYRTMGYFGLTNADPNKFLKQFENFPSDDPTELADRSEFWIVLDNLFEKDTKTLDEYRISMDRSGTFHVWRNYERSETGRMLTYSDADLKYYPFFFLNGRINSIGLFGLLSKNKAPPQVAPLENDQPDDDDSTLCQLCCEEPANCILVPCYHIFFCSSCRPAYERSRGMNCPVCRQTYDEVIEPAAE